MSRSVIVYTRPDGGLSVVSPVEGVADAVVWDRSVPANAIDPHWCEWCENCPKDRTFRGAWEKPDKDKPVQVNMPKAIDIHMDRIRTVRDKALAILDIETIKAVGSKDDVMLTDVEAQKQILRDIPQTFDLSIAKTPEELMVLWPEELEQYR